MQAGSQAGGEPGASPAHQVCLGRAGEGAAQPTSCSSTQVMGIWTMIIWGWTDALGRPGQCDGKGTSEVS